MLSTGPLAAHRHLMLLPALIASATVFLEMRAYDQPDGGAVKVAR